MNAWLAFLDESGLLMAPLLRRTWSLRGQTPILHRRTRHRQKVSISAALCVPPERDRVHLYFRLHRAMRMSMLAVSRTSCASWFASSGLRCC